jgi:hypothetical protein
MLFVSPHGDLAGGPPAGKYGSGQNGYDSHKCLPVAVSVDGEKIGRPESLQAVSIS